MKTTRTTTPAEPGADEADTTAAATRPWSRATQDLAMVLWPSFLAAGAATMFAFAWVDPQALADCDVAVPFAAGRLAGYGLGFFFFWGITASASGITLYLARTLRTPPTDTR